MSLPCQGATAGHELTHGYDDEGVQYYVNGTLDKYIDESSSQGFANMAQCVIGQYSSQCCPPDRDHLCANGITTQVHPQTHSKNKHKHKLQGENIADNGGVKEAFRVRCAA